MSWDDFKFFFLQVLPVILMIIAVGLLIYIALVIPGECHSCMSNGVNYYMNKTNATCWCDNLRQVWG